MIKHDKNINGYQFKYTCINGYKYTCINVAVTNIDVRYFSCTRDGQP